MMKSVKTQQSNRGLLGAMGSLAFLMTVLLSVSCTQAFGQGTAPTLGTAQTYAVLGSSTVTNTGSTVVTGDLGVSPGTAVVGFPPGIVTGGAIHAADAVALQAQKDNVKAYNSLAGEACNTSYGVPTDLGGKTLVPGVYCFASSAGLTGALTLDAGGNPAAVFIFKVGSTLITASDATVTLVNGASQCNVFWQVGSSATLGTRTHFIGSILALASITMITDATLSGRALAQTGAVTMDTNTVSIPTCAAPPVNAPPVVGKSFTPSTILAGANSKLTITLSNPNSTTATITSVFTDSLPSGVVVSGAAANTCGGVVTAALKATSVSMTGGTIPANGACTITVNVTAPVAGTYVNSIPAGALKTSIGNSVTPAVATLSVTPVTTPTIVPPTLGKSFNPANIIVGGTSSVVLTLSNSNRVVDTITAPLTDHLPAGMLANGVASTTCGGVVTAPKGSTTVTLTGGAIPAAGSCTVTVGVTVDCACSYYNSVAAGALQTDNGNNAAAAVATLIAGKVPTSGPPTLSKFFYPAEIKPGGSTTLTITLANPNPAAALLTAVFVDTLPSGMVVAGLPTSVPSNTCGGTLTAVKGSSSVSLTGGRIPAYSTCALTVIVSVAKAGTYTNSLGVGVLKTSKGNNATGYKAVLTVSTSAGAGPRLIKSFAPSTIVNDGVTTLTITLVNPAATAAKLTAPLIDYMPAKMVVYGSPANTCGGTLTAVKGSSTITLTGGAIPANGYCQLTVKVTAPCNNYFNNLPVGVLKTTNGINQEPAGASLTVTAH
jgi:Ice-binding-like